MSRVQPPGSPWGSPFSTPLLALGLKAKVAGAQVASAGLMYLLIVNGLLEAKWLSAAGFPPGGGFGSVTAHLGASSPGWVLPSSHFTCWLTVARLASFW